MLKYKIDVMKALKDKGITTTRLRKDCIIAERSLTAIRAQKPIHWTTLEKLCDLLDCQPNDILENVKAP